MKLPLQVLVSGYKKPRRKRLGTALLFLSLFCFILLIPHIEPMLGLGKPPKLNLDHLPPHLYWLGLGFLIGAPLFFGFLALCGYCAECGWHEWVITHPQGVAKSSQIFVRTRIGSCRLGFWVSQRMDAMQSVRLREARTLKGERVILLHYNYGTSKEERATSRMRFFQ